MKNVIEAIEKEASNLGVSSLKCSRECNFVVHNLVRAAINFSFDQGNNLLDGGDLVFWSGNFPEWLALATNFVDGCT